MNVEVLDTNQQLKEISVEDLKNISGKVLLPQDPHFDRAREIWNAMIDRKPAFIVQVQSNEDVVSAVRFAKNHKLALTIRGAGHNIAGRALCDNMMLIDCSQMRDVKVDKENKTVLIKPGATLGDIDTETQKHGLSLPIGFNSTTGIAGLTLGGGYGWLSRKYGMTIDHLLSLKMVNGKGDLITIDENNHPDLFWALRGGGGNFGVVTEFHFKLVKNGPDVMCGTIIFDFKDVKDVLKKYNRFCKDSPNELTIWSMMRHCPPFPFVDPMFHGKMVLILVCFYSGDMMKGKEMIEEIKKFGKPIGSNIGPQKFVDFQQAFDPLVPPRARNYWKTLNFAEISDVTIDVLPLHVEKMNSNHSGIFIGQLGGQIKRVNKHETAYPHRDTEFVMIVHTRWESSSEDQENIHWAKDFYNALEPHSLGGSYINFMSVGDDSIEEAFGENLERLKEIKKKYDPENRFYMNLRF